MYRFLSQGICHILDILDAVNDMDVWNNWNSLTLTSKLDTAMGACQNIQKILFISTYISQNATTNSDVTELVVNQCEEHEE